MASPRHVVVVEPATPVDTFEDELSDATVSTASASEVMVELCRSAVDCLVIDDSTETLRGDHLSYAAHGLYPDLPVVVFGPKSAESDHAVTVDAETLTDEAVLTAVRDALDVDSRPQSARPPSRPETMLASMFDGYPVHLYAKDTEARHLIASDHIIDSTDLLGLTDMETLSGDETYDEANYTDDWQVIDEGTPILEIDEYADSKDLFFRTSKVPWRDEHGDILGLVGITQDITELREQKEELRWRNRRLRKVALMTAHELRNELQVLTGHCSQIEDTDAHKQAASDSIEHLSGIVDKIVSLATYNERERDPTTMWLSALVRDIWEGQSTAEATLSLSGDRRLLGDRDATQLLVEMLLDNALVHGGPEISVEVGGTDDGFYVADDGPGIDFEPPSYALEPAVTSVESASGFGLYIAQQIADEQGWTIEVRNLDDGGARFDVTGIDPV